MLIIEGLAKRFGATKALAGVSFAIEPGCIHGLVGGNGAGKSTLIRCLAGAHQPDDGTILLDGMPVRFAHPRDASRAGIRIVHQELALVPGFDAAENILLGERYPTRFGLVDRAAMRAEVAAQMVRLAPMLDVSVPARRLSTGERQLVEIARALRGHPRLLILDEPTTALGAHESERLHAVLRGLAGEGVAVLYVSHRLGDVLALCSRLTVMRDGRAVFDGPSAGLGPEALVAHMVAPGSAGDRTVLPPTKRRAAPPVLEARGLRLRAAAPPFDLTLRAGAIVGLYGLLGSGRSRLLRTLWGGLHSLEGSVAVDGAPLRPASIRAAVEAGLALVPEDRRREGLFLAASVAANASLPTLRTFRAIPALPWPSRGRQARFAGEIASRLAIRMAGVGQKVGALSGGNQQKVLVGRWLRRRPRVLLLDEPTRGIDARAKAELHEALRHLAREGTAILFASGDLEEVLALADRLLVMREGAVAAEIPDGERTEAGVLSRLFRPEAATPA